MNHFITYRKDGNIDIDFNKLHDTNTIRISTPIVANKVYIRNAATDQLFIDIHGSIRAEEIFILECSSLRIYGVVEAPSDIVGSIKVVGDIDQLEMAYIHSQGGEHGLLMSQHNGNECYGQVILKNCAFFNHSGAGVYIGKSDGSAKAPQIEKVTVKDCKFHLNGKDGIQVARTTEVRIQDSSIVSNGLLGEYGQDYNLTINPKCERTYLEGCEVGSIQYLDGGRHFIKGTLIHG